MAPPNQPKRGRSDVDNDDDKTSNDCEIKDMLLSLSNKMDSLSNTMSAVNNRLNDRIDGLESSLCAKINDVKLDFDKRITLLSADVDKRLDETLIQSNRKCEDATTKVYANFSQHLDEIRDCHDLRLDKLERLSLDKELIITGVPMESNDNPWSVLGDICKAMNCNLNERDFTAVFRLKSKNGNSNRSVPIVVKVYDNIVKQEFLSCYFKRANLNLKDIGFQTSARIFVNESLTKSNREIFNLAAEAKKSNKIVKLFTRNGLVHIQRCENEKPICIYHVNEVHKLIPMSSSDHTSSQSSSTSLRRGVRKSNKMAPNHNGSRSINKADSSLQAPTIGGATNSNSVLPPNDASVGITPMEHETSNIPQSKSSSSISI